MIHVVHQLKRMLIRLDTGQTAPLMLPGKRYGVEEKIGTSAETTTTPTKAELKNYISVFRKKLVMLCNVAGL